ncbi:hypothetical protein [Neoroseomonas rubea]|uniref:hypothetical protein n=1 Tax=Neoroseomonas rubea TaxID=2748666 RepID=UPI0018E03DFF|nr:hypothetical protein [Roseomonas rubea]
MRDWNFLGCPECFREELRAWILHAIAPDAGDGTLAVLNNDLRGAVAGLDGDRVLHLPALVRWLAADAPALCWGSPAAVAGWPQHHVRHRTAPQAVAAD